MFGDLRFVPNDPTTIGACFAAQTEELITAILDRSISLLLCLLLRALFFVSKPRRLCCKSRSFLQFFSRETSSKNGSFCLSRDQKRKIFVCKFVHVVSPPLRGSHASKISGNWCVFCGVKFQFSLPLHKIKTLLKEYSLIHAHAPHHKKETSSGDAPPFDLLKPFRVLIDTGE